MAPLYPGSCSYWLSQEGIIENHFDCPRERLELPPRHPLTNLGVTEGRGDPAGKVWPQDALDPQAPACGPQPGMERLSCSVRIQWKSVLLGLSHLCHSLGRKVCSPQPQAVKFSSLENKPHSSRPKAWPASCTAVPSPMGLTMMLL